MINKSSTLNNLLNILLPLILPYVDVENFRIYLLGFILQERWFSTYSISKRNTTKSLWQLYNSLKSDIKWNKVFYTLAKRMLSLLPQEDWYLVVDGTPLNQQYARNRITRQGLKSIEGMKNVPHNELISLALTNGVIYIPLNFKIWTSKKVTKPNEYRKKTDMFFSLVYEYLIMKLPVKSLLFDNYFASASHLNWLIDKGFIWTTRIKSNKKVKYGKKNCKLTELDIGLNESLLLQLVGVCGYVKVIRICHRNEDVYIATNDMDISDKDLIRMYKKRWTVEEFHRESKQHLGLEYIYIRSWQKLQNHVGFVCLSYGLLSVLRNEWGGSIGDMKYIIHDEVYQIHNAHERFVEKLAS